MTVLNFSLRGRLPVIRQTEAAKCGLVCLAMVASFYRHKIDLNTLRRRHPVSLNGVTLRALIQVARHLHLTCRPLRFELANLRQLRLPAILHWDMNHFVVLKSVTRKGIVIHDPAFGERFYSFAQASNPSDRCCPRTRTRRRIHCQGRARTPAALRLLERTARER